MAPPKVSPPCSGGGLCDSVTRRVMPAVAYLMVGSPMPDRSKGRAQTNRDTLVLQDGGWA